MADIEARMNTAEYRIDEHGKQITELHTDVNCIKNDCTNEKITNGKLDQKLDGLLSQVTLIANTNKDSLALIKWIIIVLATIIIALLGVFGVKVALPSI